MPVLLRWLRSLLPCTISLAAVEDAARCFPDVTDDLPQFLTHRLHACISGSRLWTSRDVVMQLPSAILSATRTATVMAG